MATHSSILVWRILWTEETVGLWPIGSQRVGHDWIDLQKNWLYKKDLHDPDNHDGVITHLEPDILECEVKWVLGRITMKKASGGDGIPVELFQILKDDAVKVLHSICWQILKTQHWPQDWKRSVFIPFLSSQRKAMPKNAETTTQLHSSRTLVK